MAAPRTGVSAPAPSLAVRPVPACYLCGETGTTLYAGLRDRLLSAPGVWDTRLCPRCGLVWLDPQPLPEMMPQLHAGYYTHGAPPGEPEGVATRLRKTARRAVLAAAFGYREHVSWGARLLGRLVSLIPGARDTVGASVRWLPATNRGRLLDVGCGGGEFLAALRSLGWDVAGIEPDPVAAEHARTHHGLTVECGTPEASALPAGSFDVVTLNHVIEHVPDPVITLRACGRLLREDGLLVIVTPNTESLGRRVFGADWMHWDPPRHFLLFTPATLETCVRRAGFARLHTRTPAQGVRPSWGASRLIRRRGRLSPGAYPGRPPAVRLEEGVALLAESLLVGLGRPSGEEIVLFARR